MRDKRTIFNTTHQENLEIMDQIERNDRGEGHLKLLSKRCPCCGNTFQQSRKWQTFCSAKCRTEQHRKERELVSATQMEKIERLEKLLEIAYAENRALKAELTTLKDTQ